MAGLELLETGAGDAPGSKPPQRHGAHRAGPDHRDLDPARRHLPRVREGRPVSYRSESESPPGAARPKPLRLASVQPARPSSRMTIAVMARTAPVGAVLPGMVAFSLP